MVTPSSPTGFFDATGRPLEKVPQMVRAATNGVIFNDRGEVLLHRRSDNGFWGLPGGGVEVGESIEQGVVREVLEETGLHVRVKRFVGIYSDPRNYCVMSYPDGRVIQYVTAVFECQRVSGELRISHESTDIGYFPVDALPRDTLVAHLVRIQDVLARRVEPFVR